MKNQWTELPKKVKLSIIKKATQMANKYQADIVNEYGMKKSKCCKAEVITKLELKGEIDDHSTNYYICKKCLKPCDVI